MAGSSWNCESCTYAHLSKAERCAMCGHLRVSKTDMIHFIQGKTMLAHKTQVSETLKDEVQVHPDENGTEAKVQETVSQNPPPIHTSENHPKPATAAAAAAVAVASTQPLMKPPNPYHNKKSVLKQSVINVNHVNSVAGNAKTIIDFEQSMHKKNPMDDTMNTSNSFHGPLDSTQKPCWEDSAAVNALNTNTTMSIAAGAGTWMADASTTTTGLLLPSVHHPGNNNNPATTNTTTQQQPHRNPYRKNNTTLVNNSSMKPTNASSTGPTPQQPPRPAQTSNQRSGPQRSVGPTMESNPHLNDPFAMAVARPSSVNPHFQPGPVPLDEEMATTWIFPQSDLYLERKYQLDICRSALLQNTLVSLPTGLGKTLIAAVVMYNYYRWFPEGRIVFLAPTRPLVSQQLDACYKVMKIPERDTAEITGRQKTREILWSTRRVFFCTPQTFQKDIEENRCDARKIVCICFDEAHKATGKYAYARVIDMVESAGAKFRVLGLSATPGKDNKSISQVLETLRISKIEARLETDPDVKDYVHERVYEIIKCDVSDTACTLENHFTQVISPLLNRIRQRHLFPLLQCSIANLSAYQVLQSKRDCNQKYQDHSLDPLFAAVQSLLTIRERLVSSGIGVARNEMRKFRTSLGNTSALSREINQCQSFLAMNKIITETLENQIITGESVDNENPKLVKLKEVLGQHFAAFSGKSSRAIVFSQWRDSVEEIVSFLNSMNPEVKAAKFVGQSSGSIVADSDNDDDDDDNSIKNRKGRKPKQTGMNQSEQQAALSSFRKGIFNVLVCTCIGEEGLDICEVDLIVNFDCLRSPIRMVQRTGRTGRNRDGRVVCLVSKGPEERRLEKSEEDTKRLWNALKKPNSFKLLPCVPLLPNVPQLERKVMNSSSTSCRLSQIGGYDQRNPNRKRIGSTLARTVEDDSWILTSVQERSRAEQFGDFQCLEQSKRRKLYVRFWQEEVMFKRRKSCEDDEGFYERKKYLRRMEEKVTHDENQSINDDSTSNHRRRTWFRSSIDVFKVHTYELSTILLKEVKEESPNQLPHCDLPSPSPYIQQSLDPIVGAASSNESTTECVLGCDNRYSREEDSTVMHAACSSAQDGPTPDRSSPTGMQSVMDSSRSLKLSPAWQETDACDYEVPDNLANVEERRCIDRQQLSQPCAGNRDQLIDAMIQSVNIVLSTQESSSDSDDSSLCKELRICPVVDSLQPSSQPIDNNGFQGFGHSSDDITPLHYKIRAAKIKKGRFIESQSPFVIPNNATVLSKSLPTSTQYLVDTPSDNIEGGDKFDQQEQPDVPESGVKACNRSEKRTATNTSNVMMMKCYLDLEAVEESDGECTDGDDEEDGDDRFDSQDSFINNSSQLGYTQGGLADESVIFSNGKANTMSLDVHMHRQVDHSRAMKEQFATPVLARKKRQAKGVSNQQAGRTQDPGGFGAMPFIRTVLEHHRHGGNADDLERKYQGLYKDSC